MGDNPAWIVSNAIRSNLETIKALSDAKSPLETVTYCMENVSPENNLDDP
ncbi:hypothetical protein [Kaistella carnis]|nr:hypothetical protein [Kaistella carnis]